MDPINPDLKTPPTISPTPKPSILLLILSIFLIISLAGIGILVYQNKQLQKQISTLRSQPTPTPTPLPAETLVKEGDPTANWKTYSNEQFGFSIHYPSEWQVQESHNRLLHAPFYGSKTSDTVKFYSDNAYIQFSSNFVYNDGTPSATMVKKEFITISDKNATKTTYMLPNQRQETTFIDVVIPNANPYRIKGIFPTAENDLIDQILSTFRFLDTTSPAPTTAPQSTPAQTNGVELKNIRYTLPSSWTATMNADNLHLSPKSGGGYLYIEAFNYPGTTGRREYYCQLHKYCIAETVFTETTIGNISGYLATRLDNSGGGEEYFGAKGNKFYIISTYSPPSPNDFDTHYQSVLFSLIF